MASIQGISSYPLHSTTVSDPSSPTCQPTCIVRGYSSHGHEHGSKANNWEANTGTSSHHGSDPPAARDCGQTTCDCVFLLHPPSNGPCALMPRPASRPPANLVDGGALIATNVCQHNCRASYQLGEEATSKLGLGVVPCPSPSQQLVALLIPDPVQYIHHPAYHHIAALSSWGTMLFLRPGPNLQPLHTSRHLLPTRGQPQLRLVGRDGGPTRGPNTTSTLR